MKTLTAAPPTVLRCDEKHLREYPVPNVVGVVITTNYKTNGIFLPPDDRRHFVAWSEAQQDDVTEAQWSDYYQWLEKDGSAHVAAYLREFDLSAFNPKAPPRKTPAFWEIVDSSRAPEDDETRRCDRGSWRPAGGHLRRSADDGERVALRVAPRPEERPQGRAPFRGRRLRTREEP